MSQNDSGKVRESGQAAIIRAFGADNRARLLSRYFDAQPPLTTESAWQHVYRLLLWIDRTTSLAHCYESDKAQPGRPWYGRSLAFHHWVSTALQVAPSALGEEIDWLFREAVKDLANIAFGNRAAAYEKQRAPYKDLDLPEPGDDAELIAIIKDSVGKWMGEEPPAAEFRKLARRITVYMTQENKRRNLVGEGFEDVVAAAIGRLHSLTELDIKLRSVLHEIPGFRPPVENEKPKKVDLALIKGNERILISAKWSIRADREEQFHSDFEAYARLESGGRDFDYTLLTNEFDPARIKAACERRRQNAWLFTNVVHINPDALIAAYGTRSTGSMKAVRGHIDSGRLMSLRSWLEQLE